MTGNVSKYARKRAYFDRIVGWNSYMMFAIHDGRKTNVAARLPRYFVTERI